MSVPSSGAPAGTGFEQSVLLAADDGSLGPLLRIADDRLPPGGGYGGHEHRAVDVVAVVLAGTLTHRWGAGGPDAVLRAGDVGVLRAGTGLAHDEVAGAEGARVLQAYLRAADPAAPPSHTVHPAALGWVALGRSDARLWVGPPGEHAEPPPGLRVEPGGGALLVWQLDPERPAWAQD